mgnify:CR=1 FL=1
MGSGLSYDVFVVCWLYVVSVGVGGSCCVVFFFFQAEDGIRYLVRSRGLGDVYKRQDKSFMGMIDVESHKVKRSIRIVDAEFNAGYQMKPCLLYTSDAADDLLCVDLGGRRIIKKKNESHTRHNHTAK